MRLVQMKPIQRMFWAKELKPSEIVSMSVEAGIPLTHLPMDPPYKEFPGLLVELQYHHSLESLSDLNLWPFSVFLRTPTMQMGFSF
jgi:hypothetical protein